uniref:Uncharacterized protein n=1 Tax=Anguilla anguilla TaxID=7936 RepID=A0A0E9PXN9_ANGAN
MLIQEEISFLPKAKKERNYQQAGFGINYKFSDIAIYSSFDNISTTISPWFLCTN